jgi:dihydrofolate reductase
LSEGIRQMKVILLMAQTLDGKIGRNSGHFPDWTGKEDKRLFVRITKAAGVLIMGSKTYDTIGGPLPGRKNVVLTRDQSRRSDSPELVFTGKSPRVVLADLQAEGYTTVVLAGGTVVNTLFARQGLIDEIMLTICPLFFRQRHRPFLRRGPPQAAAALDRGFGKRRDPGPLRGCPVASARAV